MAGKIIIRRKTFVKGLNKYNKTIILQIGEETLAEVESLTIKTNRSRNELINMLLEASLDIVKVED